MFSNSSARLFSLSWLLPLVLLALPNCALQLGGLPGGGVECVPGDVECEQPAPVFEPGNDPADAIFCDIPKPLEANDDGCATKEEADDPANISLAEAATALVNGEFKTFALDYSDPAACGGLPKKINYFGEFPAGERVCINCGTQIPNVYPSMLKACAAKCQDLVNQNGNIPAEGAAAFCDKNVKLSTNHQEICYQGACKGGSPDLSWVDPRKSPEPVVWIDHAGTSDNGGTNSLERTFMTTGTGTVDFNAGAASAQIIKGGDAWVEFSALNATDKAHVLGVRESRDAGYHPCFDAVVCPDLDPGLDRIGFAINLNTGGQVFVFESVNGVLTTQGPFGTYTPGERYRVNVTDNHDNTATISYSRQVAGVFTQFAKTTLVHPEYPLRVDTSFREKGAVIENATIVRIK